MLVFHLDYSRHEDCLVIIVSVGEHETRTEFGVFCSVVWFRNMPFCFWNQIIVSTKFCCCILCGL